jgi:hypothetical protein
MNFWYGVKEEYLGASALGSILMTKKFVGLTGVVHGD